MLCMRMKSRVAFRGKTCATVSRTLLMQYGPMWVHMGPYWPIWAHTGPICTHMGPDGSVRAQTGPTKYAKLFCKSCFFWSASNAKVLQDMYQILDRVRILDKYQVLGKYQILVSARPVNAFNKFGSWPLFFLFVGVTVWSNWTLNEMDC